MSNVTNVIFTPGLLDEDYEPDQQRIQKLNEFFTDQRGFVDADDESLPCGWYGGAKMLEATLLIGAFNYLDLEGLIEHIRGIQWEDPECVQLIVKEQEEDRFKIINVFDDLPEGKVVAGSVGSLMIGVQKVEDANA